MSLWELLEVGVLQFPMATDNISFVAIIRSGIILVFLGLYGFGASGCMSYTTYEGSEGAGEREIRKRSIFLLCMKTHNWILK